MNNRQHAKKRNHGFTLVELMIVVAILGLLIAIAIPNFQAAQLRAKVASVKANMHSLQTVIEIYATNFAGLYPENLTVAEAEARHTTSDVVDYWVEFTNPMNDKDGLGNAYDDMPAGGTAAFQRGVVYYEVNPSYFAYWIYGSGNEIGSVVKNVGESNLVLTNGYNEL